MPKKMKFNMPDSVVVVENKDKGNWVESWHKPVDRSPGFIPHPFRALMLGQVSRGKTNMIKNLFLKHQASSKPFQRLIICCCDITSEEWSDCCPDFILDKLPPLSLFDGSIKTCLVCDDFEFKNMGGDELKKLTTLFRMTSSHKNLSIFASYQSFFDCPSIARKCCNLFLLYKPTSKMELKTIANRIGIDSDDLKQLYKKYCPEHYDCLVFDKTKDSPFPIRKNIYTLIDYNSDSSDNE